MAPKNKLATAFGIAVAALALAATAPAAARETHSATASGPTTACPLIDAVLCWPYDGDPPGWPRSGEQSIMFGPLANKSFGDPDFSVHATASSGLRVAFAARGNCTVYGRTVHITGLGACTITASQRGSTTYGPAKDVAHTFSITKGATATAIPASGTWGASVNLPYWIRGKGNVATSIAVQKNGSTVARLGNGFSDVIPGGVYGFAWKAPTKANGAFSFCVTLKYHAKSRSAASCARIHLR